MLTAGVDIGSTSSKIVVLDGTRVAASLVSDSSTNPSRTARSLYDRALAEAAASVRDIAFVVGTGYGRTQVPFAHKNVSEITCHGRGAHHLQPDVRTIIDIGGQDTKVICVDERGQLLDFAMNDKCAAGTGRFLEAMARSMGVGMASLDSIYDAEAEPCPITSMCSVFAESEVINLVNDGVPMPRIVKGLLLSLAQRVSSLALRAGVIAQVAMTGGVARSRAVRDTVATRLKVSLSDLAGFDPQRVGALGAALLAQDFAAAQGKVDPA